MPRLAARGVRSVNIAVARMPTPKTYFALNLWASQPPGICVIMYPTKKADKSKPGNVYIEVLIRHLLGEEQPTLLSWSPVVCL